MNEILQFLGHYWWVVFPLMGVLGGAGRAWERSSRQRHKRRLEVIRAKAELKAAARGQVLPTGAQPVVAASPPVDAADTSTSSLLTRLFADHDGVTARWLEYELDVAKLIAFPAMSDGRQPLTAAFLRAKKLADGLRPASAKAKVSRDQLTDYRNAVADYEVAFDVAERDARRIRDSSFTPVERKRLDTAKQLITVAIDEAATPAERQLAYKRVREELDGLISLSDGAIEVLEAQVALELTAGRETTPAPPAPSTADETPDASPADSSTPPLPVRLPSGTTPAPSAPAREPKTGPWPVPSRPDTGTGRVTHPKSPR
ncbi:hypothetical protein ACFM35_12105 [Microbacterium sp. P01]|uniref:hypothetical protein n=1 Tax=unclassified Microbacterium TaxID=2609290 RepID=UPI00366F011A